MNGLKAAKPVSFGLTFHKARQILIAARGVLPGGVRPPIRRHGCLSSNPVRRRIGRQIGRDGWPAEARAAEAVGKATRTWSRMGHDSKFAASGPLPPKEDSRTGLYVIVNLVRTYLGVADGTPELRVQLVLRMFDYSRTPSPQTEPAAQNPPVARGGLALADIFGLAARHTSLVLTATALACALVGALATKTLTPRYMATAQIYGSTHAAGIDKETAQDRRPTASSMWSKARPTSWPRRSSWKRS